MDCTLRFYEELNDFLPEQRKKREFVASFPQGCTAKAAIETCGVPHTEVDLVLANGESVDFSYRLKEGDRLSVYPVFESLDVGKLTRVRPEPLRDSKFVCDVHLGKLARLLRLLGFDALYWNDLDDEQLVAVSRGDRRAVLTRDRGLLKRREVTHGYCVRSPQPKAQLTEVVRRFQLERLARPFSRCVACNAVLVRVDKADVTPEVPPLVSSLYDEFSRCPSCQRVFWRGTHWERLRRLTDSVLGEPPGCQPGQSECQG